MALYGSSDEEGRPRRCRRNRPASRSADGEPTNCSLPYQREPCGELVHTLAGSGGCPDKDHPALSHFVGAALRGVAR